MKVTHEEAMMLRALAYLGIDPDSFRDRPYPSMSVVGGTGDHDQTKRRTDAAERAEAKRQRRRERNRRNR